MNQIGTPLQWGLFFAFVLGMLALDLGVFHRKEHRVSIREAVFWSVFWTLLALAFNGWIYAEFGPQLGLEFLTGYVIERSLSFDNIFVFIVIFNYFAVPAEYQHRVLFWGILGALISRGVFIALGTALLARFEWLILVFGAFLVYTGVKILLQKEAEVHPERNPVLRLFQRFVPLTVQYHGKKFFVREDGGGSGWGRGQGRGQGRGRLVATPLMLVLVVVEATDVVFAVDSIPAVFGVTRDPFIVFTSNIFAILGLRALYFLLAGLMHKFRYLGFGLGLVLVFVGAKMVLHDWVPIPIELSLGIVMLILTAAIVVSLMRPVEAEAEAEVTPSPTEIEPGEFEKSEAARELVKELAAQEETARRE